MQTLQDTVAKILAALSNITPIKSPSLKAKAHNLYLAKVRSELEALSKESEEELINGVKSFLAANWEFVKGSCFSYTAIPNATITQGMCALAENLAEMINSRLAAEDTPVTALELLMPGLALTSHDDKYPNFAAIKFTPGLNVEEQRELARLSRLNLNADKFSEKQEACEQFWFLKQHNASNEELEICKTKYELTKVMLRDYADYQELLKLKEKEERAAKCKELLARGAYKKINDYLVYEADLEKILATHILSEDTKSLIPVAILLEEDLNKRPYHAYLDNGAVPEEVLAKEEIRLINHSSTAEAYTNAQANLERVKADDSNLLGNLTELCKQLKLNDAHVGFGKQDNAGRGAYPAILKFNDYYNSLSAEEITKIPESIKAEIDLLLDLSFNIKINDDATANMQTCIGTRRVDLERVIKNNEEILANIANKGENKERLISKAKLELDEAKTQFQDMYFANFSCAVPHERLIRMTVDEDILIYDEKDKLPLTKKILAELHIEAKVKSLEDLNAVMRLNNNDIISLFFVEGGNEEIVNAIKTLDTLYDFFLEQPLNKIATLLAITSPLIFNQIITDEQSIKRVLFGLSDEKIVFIASKLLLAGKEKYILHILSSANLALLKVSLEQLPENERFAYLDKFARNLTNEAEPNSELLKLLLELLPSNKRFDVIKQKDINGSIFLHKVSANPSLLRFILELLPENQRLEAIKEKANNYWGYTLLDHVACTPDSLRVTLEVLTISQRLALLMEKDRNGDTLLHKVALFPNSIRVILDLLPENKRLDVVKEKDKEGNTLLHKATSNKEILQTLLELYKEEERLGAIKEKNINGDSVMHCASRSSDSLKMLLALYREDLRLDAVKEEDHNGDTVIDTAYPASIRVIFELLPKNKLLDFIKVKDKNGNILLTDVAHCPELLKFILESIPENDRVDVLRVQNANDSTVLQRTQYFPTETIKIIFELLPKNQLFAAGKEKDKDGRTVLHYAAFNDDFLLKSLLELYLEEERLDALKEKDKCGHTVLHNVVSKPELLKEILKLLPENQRLDAIKAKDSDGSTVLHLAAEANPDSLKVILALLPVDLESVGLRDELLSLRKELLEELQPSRNNERAAILSFFYKLNSYQIRQEVNAINSICMVKN